MEISLVGREWQGDIIQIQWDVYKISQNSFWAEVRSAILVSLGYIWNVASSCSGAAADLGKIDIRTGSQEQLTWLYPLVPQVTVYLTEAKFRFWD